LDDPVTYHELSLDYTDPLYADPATQAKIQSLEHLEIRPAITVYKLPEE
jgi:hypothetical protein